MAAPATVSGEFPHLCHWPNRWEGKGSDKDTMSQETCQLLLKR